MTKKNNISLNGLIKKITKVWTTPCIFIFSTWIVKYHFSSYDLTSGYIRILFDYFSCDINFRGATIFTYKVSDYCHEVQFVLFHLRYKIDIVRFYPLFDSTFWKYLQWYKMFQNAETFKGRYIFLNETRYILLQIYEFAWLSHYNNKRL